LESDIAFVRELVKQGGPKPEHYVELDHKFRSIAKTIRNSSHPEHLISSIREALNEALTIETVQGYGFNKPFGYSGDFYMIDKIYQKHISPDDNLRNWDIYFHSQKAPIAVRNRKQYFLDLLDRIRSHNQRDTLQILNIACGPCRDVYEYLDSTKDKNIHFHCVDYDQNAIAYALNICEKYLDQLTFYHKNALRFRSHIKFNLAWSAGLLDYFTDKQFKFMLKKLCSLVTQEGEVVVGNFHPDNPSRDYMEIVGDWYLNYRTECDLIKLAKSAGVCLNDIRVGVEEEYVNLFLHIKCGKSFI
jgi:SAM-dependent methyltransferase